MSVAEATNTNGTVLGALITFFLYGALPLSLVLYIMRTPARRRAIKAKEKAENASCVSVSPDASGHSPSAEPAAPVTAVRKEL